LLFRNRPDADRTTIQELIRHLFQHHQYSAFEEFYIGVTRTFYQEESANQAQDLEDDPQTFFQNAQDRITAEVQRAKAVLPVPTWNLVQEATEAAIWHERTEWIANTSTFKLAAQILETYFQNSSSRRLYG